MPPLTNGGITHSRTFGKPVTEFEDMVEPVCTYTAKAVKKLRKEHRKAAGTLLSADMRNPAGMAITDITTKSSISVNCVRSFVGIPDSPV